jgi:hypothetical protein
MSAPSWSRYGSRLRRLCARAGCNAPAVATLRFEPTERLAWLAELDESAARTQGDLCQRHAAALVLPRGWQLHDERVAAHRVDPVDEPPEPVAEETVAIEIVEAVEKEVAGEASESEVEATAEAEAEPAAAPNGNGARSVPAQFGATDDDAVDEAITGELDTILDARTPLLQRAFRNARPQDSNN